MSGQEPLVAGVELGGTKAVVGTELDSNIRYGFALLTSGTVG